MRIALIIVLILVGLFIVFQIYVSMSTKKTETQSYQIIKVEQEFEIRLYPAVTMATIASSANTYKELSSPGFSKLAGYLFGGNKENMRIAMTSPVHMDIGNTASTMSFVMPSNYTKSNLPQPNDTSIKIITTTEEYVAALKFDGFASNEKIKMHAQQLENALKKHNLSYYGNFRFLGYNPPFQLLDRRNEIIVALKYNSQAN